MSISNQRGNVLLFAISGIAMIAALAMGMFYMTSTSSLGQAGGSGMNRAYYLALAGKDYALANWNIRSQLTGNEFTVSSTERFSLSITDSQITSTGIVNKDTPFEAKKIITAQSPSPVRKHFFESFEDKSKWDEDTKLGTFDTPLVSGDKALQATGVTTSGFGSGTGSWSFLQLKTGAGFGSAVDFSPAWKDAGYCLSHDLQVKIANILPPQPYYMAGLNFKVAGSENSRKFYGISFLRARQTESCSGCDDWLDNDYIPSELKPPAIWNTYTPDGLNRYSQPAIVLWKRYWDNVALEYKFTWLAYKLLTDADYVVDSSGYLKDWSNLQVRLNEAHQLAFTNGGPDPILHNAVVKGENSGAIGRISGSAIVTSGSWESGNAAGILTLSNICIPCPPASCPTFQSGENLQVNDKIPAKVSGTLGAKSNYIRIYYGDVISHGTSNFSTDNNRGSNSRIVTGSGNIVHWPVDNMSDWQEYYDYMTLVTWDGINTAIVTNPPAKLTELIKINDVPTFAQFDTIIRDSSLLTPTPPNCSTTPAIDYSGIALHATGNTATSTYFDDFAIQY